MIGRTLAQYRITAAIGAGGMGEVYRATDTKLGREVALKLLPEAFAADPDRLARFEREAKVLASLNHPGIAHLYGFENATLADGAKAHFLAMELVEGEDLAERLKRGAIPVDEAVGIAKQVAEALEEAHEKGIVHRDLKPANVKVTPDGKVKVLDFGLAKAWTGEGGGAGSSADMSQSPTLAQTGTAAGIILGTAAYMSPEQARGKAVDRRADIWAFGVVLYEMLTGRRLFQGETVSDTLAAVLKTDPDWASLPTGTPDAVRALLRRCLAREPKQRLRDIGEARIAVDDLGAHLEEPAGAPAARQPNRLSALLALALALATIGLAWATLTRRPAAEARVVKLSLLPPEKTSFAGVAVSPDGRWIAFTAATGGKVQLWVRALDASESKALGGTESATKPFWSPDSRTVGFFAGGKLKKIDAAGGIVSTLCDVGVSNGGTWGRDGVILFSRLGGVGISRVSVSGGEVVPVMRVDARRQETDYANPFFLPDGRHFLYNVFGGAKNVRGVYVGSLDGSLRQRLVGDNTNAVYAASNRGGGFLLFGRDGALVAQAFDAGTLQLIGDVLPIAPHLGTNFDTTAGGGSRRLVSASDNGVLVFDPFSDRQSSHLVWVDRAGRQTGAPDRMDNVSMVRLSPDGRRYAVSRLDSESGYGDIWVSDATGGNATRLTFDPGNDSFPVWSPDGDHLAWASNREGTFRLYQKAASGSGQDALLLKADSFVFPTDWSRDAILYRQIDPKTRYDIWALPVGPRAGDGKAFPFLQTEANETAAVSSPDGRWVAYASDESGRYEVYVQGFPRGGGKRQVSSGGGIAPEWQGDGNAIFFHALDGTLMTAAVERGASFAAGAPTPLFEFRPSGPLVTPYYGVTPDGRRFLLSTVADTMPGAPLTIVLNWTAALEE